MENRIFLVENREIQVIVFMIMTTRSSQRIFSPMRYTGFIYISLFCGRQGYELADTSGNYVHIDKYFMNLVKSK